MENKRCYAQSSTYFTFAPRKLPSRVSNPEKTVAGGQEETKCGVEQSPVLCCLKRLSFLTNNIRGIGWGGRKKTSSHMHNELIFEFAVIKHAIYSFHR